MRAYAARVNGCSGGEPEGGGQLKSKAALEFGGTKDGVLSPAFKGDQRAAVQMSGLSEKIEVGAGSPRPQTPGQAGPFVCAFPR
jgi:hypothetical protein